MYEPMVTNRFIRNSKKLERKKKGNKIRIYESVQNLIADPYGRSESLKGNYKGKRKNRVGDFRLVFAICKECKELNHTEINRCVDCGELSDKTLKFFDVSPRPQAYR